jgi:hypothetical protein
MFKVAQRRIYGRLEVALHTIQTNMQHLASNEDTWHLSKEPRTSNLEPRMEEAAELTS